MKTDFPKISVLIICYNQEKVISRAIESLLKQKDYIYEICVSDDCSQDKTWDVLQDYSAKFPGLFVLNRNEHNIGIFENNEKSWTMANGDLVYQMAGDDECPQGWFKTVVDFIKRKKLDYENDFFAVYGDYEVRYPEGESFVFLNKAILSGLDQVRLSMRGIIGNRSAVFTRKVIESYKIVSKGRSHIAESAQDRQLPFFAKKVYYVHLVGNIYYARIGVSAVSQTDEKVLEEREETEPYSMEVLKSLGYTFKKTDEAYIQLRGVQAKSYRDKSLSHYIQILKLKILSFDPAVSFKAFRFKRYLFALIMRLPHSKSFRMTV